MHTAHVVTLEACRAILEQLQTARMKLILVADVEVLAAAAVVLSIYLVILVPADTLEDLTVAAEAAAVEPELAEPVQMLGRIAAELYPAAAVDQAIQLTPLRI